MQVAAEYGLAGRGLFLAFVFSLLYHYEKKYRAAGRDEEFFAFAVSCAVIGLLSESFFNFPLLIMPSAVIFWFLCGVLNSIIIKNSPDKESVNPGKPVAVILLLLLAVLTAAAAASAKFNPVSDFYMKKALQLDEENSAANYGVFRKAISLSPRDFYAHFYLADSYSKTLLFPEAIAEYKIALSIYPYSADMLYNTGSLLVMNKGFNEAEKYLRRSIALYPDFALSRLYLAKTLSFMGRDAEAAQEFAEARGLDPSVFGENAGAKVVYFGEVTGSFDK
jgi:tetratricopeptide (TPR) repeat protein